MRCAGGLAPHDGKPWKAWEAPHPSAVARGPIRLNLSMSLVQVLPPNQADLYVLAEKLKEVWVAPSWPARKAMHCLLPAHWYHGT